MRKAKVKIFALSVIASVLAASGWAWACTRQVAVSISPKSGPAGTTVIVTGQGFNRLVPVEIFWRDLSGPKLAETSPGAGSFSVEVRIPAAPPQVYDVIVQQSDSVQGTLRATDRFTLVPDATHSQQVSSGTARGPGNEVGSGSPQGAAEQVPGAIPRSDSPDVRVAEVPSTTGPESGPAQVAPPAARAVPAPAEPVRVPEAATSGGLSAAPEQVQAPQLATVDQDLWSGFAPQRRSLGEAGLREELRDSRRPWIAGVSLLAAGVVGLLSALVVAESKLRRYRASS